LTARLQTLAVAVTVEPELRVLRAVDLRGSLLKRGARIPDSDVVVLWTMALLGEALNAKRSGARVGVSVHELLPGRVGDALVEYVRWLKVPVQYNSMIVGHWLRQRIESSRLSLAYPVVEARQDAPRRTSAPTQCDPFTMLLMGRINGSKGHLETLRAFANLGRPDTRLLLAGTPFPGQERHQRELEETARDVCNVEVLGQVDDRSLLASQVDVVLTLPSRPESLGLQPLEFWSLGVRSAGWSWGGQAEVLRLSEGVPLPHDPSFIKPWLGLLADNWNWVARAPSRTAPVARLCTAERRALSTRKFLEQCVDPA
jgi:hypothetical protein